MLRVAEIFRRAQAAGVAIPAFNIPYLPMVEPVVQAVVDQDSFALVEVARLEWIKFESQGPAQVAAEFARWSKPEHVRLHLDHVPVIDEDDQRVDYLPIFEQALVLGYESVMIDGSRLPLDENIRAACQVVELAHTTGVAVEAELGAVFGHEAGPLPSYEALYASGRGFTNVDEAGRLVRDSGCDWLSVAIGNIHGAIARGRKDQKKVEARLNLERLEQLVQATQVPLVLHGGSGIRVKHLRQAMKCGITKINIGTEIRQPYEAAMQATGSIIQAQQAVYERTTWVISAFLGTSSLKDRLVKPGLEPGG